LQIIRLLAIALALSIFAPAMAQQLSSSQITNKLPRAAQGLANGGSPSKQIYKRSISELSPIISSQAICLDEDLDGLCGPTVIGRETRWLWELDGFQPEPSPLPKVTVTSVCWSNGWCSVCSGENCADLTDTTTRGERQSWLVELLIEVQDIREHEEDACKRSASQPTEEAKKIVANTTSHDNPVKIHAAASLMFVGSNSAQRIASSGTSLMTSIAVKANTGWEVTFTLSDGGKVTYYVTDLFPSSMGLHESNLKAGSLIKGTGVSRCPK
jgi:hypothetical protein